MAEQFVAIYLYYSFIDGTVEGTDIHTEKVDNNVEHNHTYYGNGCEAGWDSKKPYYGGSTTSCSSRIARTYESEEQSIGTYYNYTASTTIIDSTGSDNYNFSDTFCPLGWQLPYSGTGGDYYDQSRSWNYLFATYNIASGQPGSTSIRSYPISVIRSGLYFWQQAALYLQTMSGFYWSITNTGWNNAYRLDTYQEGFNITESGNKTYGQPVRCTLGISNLKNLHGIRVRL